MSAAYCKKNPKDCEAAKQKDAPPVPKKEETKPKLLDPEN